MLTRREITTPSAKDNWLADVPAFTEALERLHQSKGLRRDLGAAGREHVLKTFSWEDATARIDRNIHELIVEGEKASETLISEGEPDAIQLDERAS